MASEATSTCKCGKQGPHVHMPQVTFSTFILSLCSSGLVHLGEVPDPDTGKEAVNLDMAKHTIDVLAMLQAKTAKCLEPEEAKLLADILYELRVKYCAKSK